MYCTKETSMNFHALFYPKSIAVIGASRTLGSVGNDLVKNLVQQGYTGKIYPVNPSADEVYKLPVYHTIADIPESFELALIAVPAKFVPTVMREAVAKGAKAAIVISAGFKEVGNQDLEDELAQICRSNDIALIGPNCLGVINPELHMNASFAGIMPAFGNIAFLSQSGALCSCVLDYAQEYDLGFSKFLSIGNKACIDEVQLLEYLSNDPQTKVIALYVEQLENAQRFIEIAHKVTRGTQPKPIIILKSGRSQEGAAAIASHTGSLAGGDAAYNALFAQSGVIRANTIRELFEFIDVFSHNPLRKVENVAIVTNAGGPGVITTDEIILNGLKLAKISDETQSRLQEFLPAAANVKNPIDILGDGKADRYFKTLEIVCSDPGVDSVMVLLTPQTMTEVEGTAKALIGFRQMCDKPIVASFMGKESVDHAVRLLEKGQVSTTSFPELGVRGLAAMQSFIDKNGRGIEHPFAYPSLTTKVASTILKDLQSGQNLPEAVALHVLEQYKLPTLLRKELHNLEEATVAARSFSGKIALKIMSPDIIHKSDAGGVMLNVNPEDLATSYTKLLERVHARVPTARLEGALAVEMAPQGGIELIVGAKKVPGLGTMVMVGLGGIYVEVFKDIRFGYSPVSKEFVQDMISSLHIFPILQGTRGQIGYDVDSLVDVIGRISTLVTDHPAISELDINPLLVLPKGQGTKVLDARIMG
jgi:acetate---CoA ligase (ADP-forming)